MYRWGNSRKGGRVCGAAAPGAAEVSNSVHMGGGELLLICLEKWGQRVIWERLPRKEHDSLRILCLAALVCAVVEARQPGARRGSDVTG